MGMGKVDKAKNWSAVNLASQESKLSFRGSFTAVAFTNWLWFRCIRPKLEETKSKMNELSEDELKRYCIEDADEVLGEFMPVQKKKDDDKKDKKDDKDKKADKKKKKDIVTLNAKEKLQV